MLGILIGVGSVVGIVSISEGAREMLLAEMDKFGGSNLMWVSPPHRWVRRDGRWQRRAYDAYLDNDDVKKIAKCSEHIVSVLPMIRIGGNATHEMNTSSCEINGTLPTYAEAKDMRESSKRGEELGLTAEELAFYDALETNEARSRSSGTRRRETSPGSWKPRSGRTQASTDR